MEKARVGSFCLKFITLGFFDMFGNCRNIISGFKEISLFWMVNKLCFMKSCEKGTSWNFFYENYYVRISVRLKFVVEIFLVTYYFASKYEGSNVYV